MSMEEPELATIHFTRGDNGEWQQSVETVKASEAGSIGLSASEVRWLLGIPEPPRKPPSYKSLLRRCVREGCTFVASIADGWEVCSTHGTARKIN